MRCFIAIDVPFEEEFKEYQDKIKDFGSFTFPKGQSHLTLKFLGEVDDKKVEKIKEKLKKIKFKSFKVSLGRLGVFPHEKHINVVWIGLEPEDKIKELQKKIENVLDVEKEKRGFKAHVTLARVKAVKDKKKLLECLKEGVKGEFVIDKFKLIKSELTPRGAIYTVLGGYNGEKV